MDGGDVAGSLLRQALASAADVLGTAEAARMCRDYLALVTEDAIIQRVTVTGACVASVHSHVHQGDVFVPSAVISEELAVVGARIKVSMHQTSTGRSAYMAVSAEAAAEDGGWLPVVASSSSRGGGRSSSSSKGRGKGWRGGGHKGK